MQSLNLRKATLEDKYLLYWWANDETVRSNAFQREYFSSNQHDRWYKQALANDNIIIYVLVSDNVPVGQVRLQYDDNGTCLIDYSIAVEQRGNGYGKKILQLVEQEVMGGTTLLGQVVDSNIASHNIFRSLGYRAEINEKLECVDYYKKIKSTTNIQKISRGGQS